MHSLCIPQLPNELFCSCSYILTSAQGVIVPFSIRVSIFIMCTCLASAQNLITNPGFESGTAGWASLWCRTANSGQGTLVNNPVHSGSFAFQITHSGSDDWSFQPAIATTVKPGEAYEFSAWANVTSPGDYSHISVAFFDSASTPITWEYASQSLTQTAGLYQRFVIRFVVPEHARYMSTRFIGAGTCNLCLDDVQLLFLGTQASGQYILENDLINLTLNIKGLTLIITDKRIGRVYSGQHQFNMLIQSVDTAAAALTVHALFLADSSQFALALRLEGDEIMYQIIPADSGKMPVGFIFPNTFATQPGDFMVLPYAAGLLIPVEEQCPLYSIDLGGWKSTMAFAGITNLSSGYMLVADDPWDSELQFSKNDNPDIYNGIRLYHKTAKSAIRYTRSGRLCFISDGGYTAMAKRYRRHADTLGYTRTFSDKTVLNPKIQWLQGAVDFWLMDNSFYNLPFIDSLRFCGLDRVVYSLYEGNLNSTAFAAFIDSLGARRLLTGRYDDYVDVYPPTHPEYPYFRTIGYPEDIILLPDGTMKKNWLSYLAGNIPFQAYYSCPSTHAGHAKQEISTELKTKHYSARFIDVELASGLVECFSPDHPQTRREDAASRFALLKTVKDEFNLVTGDEECHDWAFPVTDYGEGTMTIVPPNNAGYDWMTPTDTPGISFQKYALNPAYRIPLHGLAFHDVHVPTWYTGDGISKVPSYWNDKDLFTALYAAMPLFMPPSGAYWQQNKIRFLTSANLATAVSRSCGFAQMQNHEFLSQDKLIQKTTFANGWTVIANFSTNPYASGSISISPKGFYATNGNSFVGNYTVDGTPVSVVSLPDRLFLNSATTTAINGLRTAGTAFLMKDSTSLSLAFIGPQNSIDINPSLLPWQLKSPAVRTRNGNVLVIPQSLDNGWLRIPRTNGEIFYQITGLGLSSNTETAKSVPPALDLAQNYPNPGNPTTTISFTLPRAGKAVLRLYDILGNEVRELCSSELPVGKHAIIVDGTKLSSGIYFYRLQFEGNTLTKKLLFIK